MLRISATGAWLAAALTVAIAAGCGGTRTLVRIGGTSSTISTADLDHWMKALAGSDFRETIGAQGPTGLVAEPAEYSRCIDSAKLVAPRSFFNQLQLSRVQLGEKCRQLHRAVKQQALRFLISAQWAALEAAEHGLTVSDAEVRQRLRQVRTARYSTAHDLRGYLRQRQWSLSDLLYQLRYELLAGRLSPNSLAVAEEAGGRLGYEKTVSERGNRLAARTHCARGYVVPGCSSYHGAAQPASAQPAWIIAHLVRKAG
jgi:hypothetical protein